MKANIYEYTPRELLKLAKSKREATGDKIPKGFKDSYEWAIVWKVNPRTARERLLRFANDGSYECRTFNISKYNKRLSVLHYRKAV